MQSFFERKVAGIQTTEGFKYSRDRIKSDFTTRMPFDGDEVPHLLAVFDSSIKQLADNEMIASEADYQDVLDTLSNFWVYEKGIFKRDTPYIGLELVHRDRAYYTKVARLLSGQSNLQPSTYTLVKIANSEIEQAKAANSDTIIEDQRTAEDANTFWKFQEAE